MRAISRHWMLGLVVCLGLGACSRAPATDGTPTASAPAPTGTATAPASTATATTAAIATASPTSIPVTDTSPPPTAVPATQGPSLGFVPYGQSVWEVPSTPDTMTGTCTAGPLSVPYGRIAITPSDNSLEFRDQGVGTYTFFMARPNVYSYAGRSNLVEGNLNMTLTFNSPQSWSMRAVTVLDADPQCQHNHDYAAVFLWIR